MNDIYNEMIVCVYKIFSLALAGVSAQLVRASSCTPKTLGFDPDQGTYLGCLLDHSLVRACMGGNRSMYLSHIYVCLSFSPFFLL